MNKQSPSASPQANFDRIMYGICFTFIVGLALTFFGIATTDPSQMDPAWHSLTFLSGGVGVMAMAVAVILPITTIHALTGIVKSWSNETPKP